MFDPHQPLFLIRRARRSSGRAVWVRCERAVVLGVFLLFNLGLPIGNWHPKIQAAATGCHCSAEQRQAGRCCCAKGNETSSRHGCCATSPPKAQRQSCCAKKPAASKATDNPPATGPVERPTWRDGCPCSLSDSPMLALCAQPRILPRVDSLGELLVVGQSFRAEPSVPCGGRPEPLVPPPKLSPVG